MSFKTEKYEIKKKAISKELANFCYAYFSNKRKVAQHLLENRWISPFDTSWGQWNDAQVPNTYSHYGDVVMETLLERLLPQMIEITSLKLVPTYSYARIYKFGDVLKRHKDRPSCEISCTINLGGEEWPIFLDPTGNTNNKGKKIVLKPGDMLAYSGCDLEHWRENFDGKDCCQVFLHYNSVVDEFAKPNEFDTRPFLGLPADFKLKNR
jgi:hypothetical protein